MFLPHSTQKLISLPGGISQKTFFSNFGQFWYLFRNFEKINFDIKIYEQVYDVIKQWLLISRNFGNIGAKFHCIRAFCSEIM